jgi:REP element-mobilizing transposase RayT
MKFNPQKYHRASTRMKGHDYSLPGAYFITLVAYQRELLFGEIVGGDMKLNRRGEIVREEWFASTGIRKEIRLFPDEFVVMPNHLHGIVWIMDMDDVEVNAGANGLSNPHVRATAPFGDASRAGRPYVITIHADLRQNHWAHSSRDSNLLSQNGFGMNCLS